MAIGTTSCWRETFEISTARCWVADGTAFEVWSEGLCIEEVMARSVPSLERRRGGGHCAWPRIVAAASLPRTTMFKAWPLASTSTPMMWWNQQLCLCHLIQKNPQFFFLQEKLQLLQSVMGYQHDACAAKTAVPAIRSMLHIEGEEWGSSCDFPNEWGSSCDFPNGLDESKLRCSNNSFEIPQHLQSNFEMDNVDGSDESGWTLGALIQKTHQRVQQVQRQKLQHFNLMLTRWMKESAEGNVEEAPKYRCGGACPVALNVWSSCHSNHPQQCHQLHL